MRKTVVSILFLVAFSILGYAQQAFRPHWSVEGQGGVTYTFGEGSFVGMLSPAVSLNVGFHFAEPVEIRLGVGGISGKGYVPSLVKYYQYDYVRGQADFIFHSFANFYTLVGAGVIVGYSNGAQQLDADKMNLVWKAPKAFATGRFGVGYRFPVSKSLAITTEAVYHLLPDALNSIRNGVPGGNVQLLAGLHFSFGNKTKKAQTPKVVTPPDPPKRDYAAEARAAVEARAAAERERFEAEQERQVVESARRVNRQVEEEVPVPEVTPEQFAEALSRAVAEAAGLSDVKVYFESNSWTVPSQYEPELNKVASFLMENRDFSVILTAYCDSRYGTAEYNKILSERRANAVARFLKKEGVEAAQILIRPAGGIDTYSKGENVKKNRFVVCEIVK
ncbi:MAG: OmpA family protein [Bacteroidales bacterium]|nr:OmpA family protein [Bacteroidales bacterium]